MSNHLIQLEGDLLIEVETPLDQVRQISGGIPEQVDKAIDSVRPLLLKVCQPLTAVWSELNKDMSISGAEIELQLGFSAQGSVFLAKASGSANLKVKISISPKTER